MSEFTSGPWEVHPLHKLAVRHPKYECWIPQCEADARLIAAAPELYEALDTLTLVIGLTPVVGNKTALQEAVDVSRAALKKARGE